MHDGDQIFNCMFFFFFLLSFTLTGFPLTDQLFQMIIRRYSDESGNMDFDNYIGCLVRLDAMCRE